MPPATSHTTMAVPARGAWMWVAMAVLAAIWLAMLLLGDGPVDHLILMSIYAGSRPALVLVAKGFTTLGEWPVVVLVSLVAAWELVRRDTRRLGFLLIVGTILERLLIILQKIVLDRVRPDQHLRLVHVSSMSFPSAHSANSMLVYPLCALLIAPERWRRLAVAGAVLLSLCIGTSRVMLGVHWPSDVVGGWAFGMFWLLALLQFQRHRRIGRMTVNQNAG